MRHIVYKLDFWGDPHATMTRVTGSNLTRSAMEVIVEALRPLTREQQEDVLKMSMVKSDMGTDAEQEEC